ncbi:hypothetical protein H9P43_004438 [Blastocladiella emersonii ATCC 22665]|nr:hypothetical protein H9P43_004438 [Blastocladiella emersonii ATCC 22665]
MSYNYPGHGAPGYPAYGAPLPAYPGAAPAAPPAPPAPPAQSATEQAYYAQMMSDPVYAAYVAQYYASYPGAAAAAAPATAVPGAARPGAVSLDLDQVILKSESKRTVAAKEKEKKAAAAAAASAPAKEPPRSGSAASASASGVLDDAASTGSSALKRKARDDDEDGEALAPPAKIKAKATEKRKDVEKPVKQSKGVEDSAESQLPRKKKMIRAAAGEVWEDKSLLDWPENDFRLFVGDLGPEVTTENLESAFGKYASFQRAYVVREKRTGKSKGYGFVSFMNAEDYTRAFQEYNNKYIGSRPVKLRKSTWQDRNIEVKRQKMKRRGF